MPMALGSAACSAAVAVAAEFECSFVRDGLVTARSIPSNAHKVMEWHPTSGERDTIKFCVW